MGRVREKGRGGRRGERKRREGEEKSKGSITSFSLKILSCDYSSQFLEPPKYTTDSKHHRAHPEKYGGEWEKLRRTIFQI